MKFVVALIIPIVILTAIIGPQFLFVVDETQLAVVTRFGEPQTTIKNPGLYSKTPFTDKVIYLEKRLLIFDAPPDSLLTKDKKRLIIDVYARGRIADPLLFVKTVTTESRASSRAIELISSQLRSEIALDEQLDVIAINREDIMTRVRDGVGPKLKDFGIEIVDVRIKRADFPAEIAESIYARMDAERKRISDAERSEGAERDLQKRAEVDRRATIIRAEAERDANIVRGQGEAEAIKIFAEALQQDPEFYTFQRSLEAYKHFLAENTTVVLPANSALFQYLQSPLGMNGGSNGGVNGISPPMPIVSLDFVARHFLARELAMDAETIKFVSSETVNWPDGSIGCPEPGKVYTQAVVAGFRLVFNRDADTLEVHSNKDGSQLVTCKP